MNPFKTNDVVRTTSGSKIGGKVRYVACKGATAAGNKTCNKKTCNCYIKDYVWVEWADGKTFSYEHTELAIVEEQSKEVVGEEIVAVEQSKTSVPAIPDLTIKKFDFDMYNGITEVRYTRDGRGYLVNKMLQQDVSKTLVEEKDLDFEAYNGKGVVRKKKL